MTNSKNNESFANIALHFLGFSLCIVPPLACTLSYFPLWKNAGYEHCIAGGSALLIVICFFPLLKFIGRVISSYSSYVAWLLCFILFFALSRIADQMTVISMVGFIGNLLGAICFKLARRSTNERE